MTYPLIGNYGRLVADDQSLRPWLRALVVANATAAVLDDARQLAALLRDAGDPGDRRRRHPGARPPPAGEREPARDRHRARVRRSRRAPSTRARAVPRWEDQDFVGQVSPSSIMDVGAHDEGGPLIGIVDFGLKSNIVHGMRRRGARVRILPHTISTAVALAARHRRPDPVAGAGRSRPASTARSRWPGRSSTTAGRCSGSASATRSSARAAGAETTRLRFGHHGANHPVRDVDLGLVQVTAQNHEVQVVGESVPAASGFRVSQVNLNDGSVEGLRHATLPIETVQYHPEGAPGPLDALAVFDRFVARDGARGEP